MEFFKKRSTAWCVLAIVVVLTFFFGRMRGPGSTPRDIDILPEGSYVQDNANILSDSTERHMAQMNNGLVSKVWGEIRVITIDSTKGRELADVALDYAIQTNLSSNSCVFIVAVDDVDALILPGDDLMYTFDEEDLHYLLLACYTEQDFAKRNLDSPTRRAFDNLISKYEQAYGISVSPQDKVTDPYAQNSYYSGEYIRMLVTFLALVIIILIIFVIISSGRRRRKMRAGSTVTRTASRTYPRNTRYVTPYYGGWSTYNSTNRNRYSDPNRNYSYSTPSGPSYSSRSTNTTPSSRTGGFGGHSRGGSFSSSGRSRTSSTSFSSSRSGTPSSRTGGFGGNSRGGSFKK